LTAAFLVATCSFELVLGVGVDLAVLVVSTGSSQSLPLESGLIVVVGSAALAETNAAEDGVHSAGRLALRVSVARRG